MSRRERQEAYDAIASVASPSDSEGLKQPRAVLLLWFLRNVLGLDDIQAYDHICDATDDLGVDGLLLGSEDTDEDPKPVLTVFQSHYPQGPTNIGRNKVSQFVGDSLHFASGESIRELLRKASLEPTLRQIIDRYRLPSVMDSGGRLKLVLLTAGILDGDAKRAVASARRRFGPSSFEVWDLDRLAPTVKAFTQPTTVQACVQFDCPVDSAFFARCGRRTIAVCSVRATDIVQWPGIDDRTLFELNVRRELKTNRVRRGLEHALKKTADHANFLAFHNGLTVICDEVQRASATTVQVRNLSVVNGTQSVVAFAKCRSHLTNDLRVVVKFVAVQSHNQLAKDVSIRSNTQTPVNARNLQALDGIQLRLIEEFKARYPDTTYVTRPDHSLQPDGPFIPNDRAAQWLCAVYTEEPWLAVKLTSLFDGENYHRIFTPVITADHVMFVSLIHGRVQRAKEAFPKLYRDAWLLTALIATYLVGQLLKANGDLRKLRDFPREAVANPGDTLETIDLLVGFAVATLDSRRVRFEGDKTTDDFKVEFKNEGVLRDLAAKAQEFFAQRTALERTRVVLSQGTAKKRK